MTAISAPTPGRARQDSHGAVIGLRVSRLLAAIGRILTALIPVFLLGSLFTYALGALSGLTPAYLQLGEGATPSAVKALDQQWGLNRGFWAQYFSWLGHVLTGNFGTSWVNNFPVTQLLANRAIISISARAWRSCSASSSGSASGRLPCASSPPGSTASSRSSPRRSQCCRRSSSASC